MTWVNDGTRVLSRRGAELAADRIAIEFRELQYLLVLAADRSIASGVNTPHSASDGDPSIMTRSGCK